MFKVIAFRKRFENNLGLQLNVGIATFKFSLIDQLYSIQCTQKLSILCVKVVDCRYYINLKKNIVYKEYSVNFNKFPLYF